MPRWIIRFVLKYIEQQIGATIDELSPINRIKKIKIPILFLHGTKDKIVPVSECGQLYRQCVSKYSKQYLIDGANHSSILANENTFNVILDFIQNFEN